MDATNTATVSYTGPDGHTLTLTIGVLSVLDLARVNRLRRAAVRWFAEASGQPMDAVDYTAADEATQDIYDIALDAAFMLPAVRHVDAGELPEAWAADMVTFARECPAELYLAWKRAVEKLHPNLLGVDNSEAGKAPGDKSATA